MIERPEIPRKMCPVIFLLDTSGSMDGAPVGAVDSAMENIMPELKSMNDTNADNEIKVALMTFDSDVKWIFGETELLLPEDVQNSWRALKAYGWTSMGAAFRELNDKLSQSHGFMKHASGSVAPVLFLLSDGEPTDDYQSGLKLLRQNPWYKEAMRVAVGYGDANDQILAEFTGNKETVLHTDNPADLKNLIRFVAITSSRVASQGSNSANQSADKTDELGTIIQAQNPLNNPLDPNKTNPLDAGGNFDN